MIESLVNKMGKLASSRERSEVEASLVLLHDELFSAKGVVVHFSHIRDEDVLCRVSRNADVEAALMLLEDVYVLEGNVPLVAKLGQGVFAMASQFFDALFVRPLVYSTSFQPEATVFTVANNGNAWRVVDTDGNRLVEVLVTVDANGPRIAGYIVLCAAEHVRFPAACVFGSLDEAVQEVSMRNRRGVLKDNATMQ